ncbi:MAG: AAA family ATPase [Desulfobacula sp.]|nr:AAA family ATPase [Desulfobacula sp.]
MDYYKLINFKKEPFSNSPDPGLFYNSKQHLEALQRLEISIRLKRGVNVVIGDIGTGKTTLSRQVIQKISNDNSITYFVMLDPGFNSTTGFLRYLLQLLLPKKKIDTDDENILKETIKKFLFKVGVDENMNIVLIIDEGQKLSLSCVEVLRELLNFETNDQKLLQIIIFAQKEFEDTLNQVQNFKDRINFFYKLEALNFKETKGLIRYRIERCSAPGENKALFTSMGLFAVYRATGGFPRKIVNLCHQVILSLITQNKSKAGFFIVQSSISKVFPRVQSRRPAVLSFFLLFIALGFLFFQYGQKSFILFDLFQDHGKGDKLVSAPLKNGSPDNQTQKKSLEQALIKQFTGKSSKEQPLEVALQKPKVYGSINAPENSTLINLISLVYGSFNDFYLREIIRFNSNIDNPDSISAGMEIFFPILASSSNMDENAVYIVIFQSKNFKAAFQKAAQHKRPGFDVRILPLWNENVGYIFPVVFDKRFLSMNEADNYKKRLPLGIVSEIKHVSEMNHSAQKQKG